MQTPVGGEHSTNSRPGDLARSSRSPWEGPGMSSCPQALSSDGPEYPEVLVYEKEADPQVMLPRGPCSGRPREQRKSTFLFHFARVRALSV